MNLELTSSLRTDEKWEKREKFIEQLLKLDFTFKVAILKNPVKLSKDLEEVLKHLVIEENIRKIVLDGRKPKWYNQRLKKLLRDKGVSVKKIVTIRKNESSPGVRVADCLAGLVRTHFDNPDSLASKLYSKLKKANKVKFELTGYWHKKSPAESEASCTSYISARNILLQKQ